MKKLILLALVLTASCSKDSLCDTGKVVSGVVAAQVGSQLSCSNIDAVKADIDKQLIKLNVCEEKPVAAVATKGAVGDVICKPLIDALFGAGISQIPSEWGCTGGPLADEAKAKLVEACTNAI